MLLFHINEENPLHHSEDLFDSRRRLVLRIRMEFEPQKFFASFPNAGLSDFGSVVLIKKGVGQGSQDALYTFGIFSLFLSFAIQLFRIIDEMLHAAIFILPLFLTQGTVINGHNHGSHGVAGFYHQSRLRTVRCLLAFTE